MAEELRKRNEIEEKYKWDLTHIYPSDEAWQKEYDEVMAQLDTLDAYDGHVAENPKKAILAIDALGERASKLYDYAFLRKETDNTDNTALALKDKGIRLYVMLNTKASFLEPELLQMPAEDLQALLDDPEMKDYDAMLRRGGGAGRDFFCPDGCGYEISADYPAGRQ